MNCLFQFVVRRRYGFENCSQDPSPYHPFPLFPLPGEREEGRGELGRRRLNKGTLHYESRGAAPESSPWREPWNQETDCGALSPGRGDSSGAGDRGASSAAPPGAEETGATLAPRLTPWAKFCRPSEPEKPVTPQRGLILTPMGSRGEGLFAWIPALYRPINLASAITGIGPARGRGATPRPR